MRLGANALKYVYVFNCMYALVTEINNKYKILKYLDAEEFLIKRGWMGGGGGASRIWYSIK